jgi:hypothetical protein
LAPRGVSAAGEAQKYSGLSVVKDGYSPHELYSGRAETPGPWSDIYALAASLYHAISGQSARELPDAPVGAGGEAARSLPSAWQAASQAIPQGFWKASTAPWPWCPRPRVSRRPRDWQRALPQPDPQDRKVVLLRRLVPVGTPPRRSLRHSRYGQRCRMPVRPRRTFLRGNAADISGLRRVSGFRRRPGWSTARPGMFWPSEQDEHMGGPGGGMMAAARSAWVAPTCGAMELCRRQPR